jgi:predicted Zn-dependent peptidase
MLDDAETLAGWHALATLSGRYPTPDARHARMLDVTREDVRAAAEAVFRPGGLGVVAVGALRAAQERALERATRAFGG